MTFMLCYYSHYSYNNLFTIFLNTVLVGSVPVEQYVTIVSIFQHCSV
jgi:hypothetical protein